jgi:hypothetical protein
MEWVPYCLTGADAYFQPDQSKPTPDLIERLLASASRPPSALHPEGALSASDISKFLSARIAESKKYNPTYVGLNLVQWLFMLNNSALLLDVVDGDVAALRTILLLERFPDGFETL